jgi:heat-inducible transcriptional repressor
MINKPKDKQILACIVDNFINTGMPIGSANLIRKYHLKWSSSTVRSVFHNLMQNGYLRQEHISSGRIPTEKGIRSRIDDLINSLEVSNENKEDILKIFNNVNGTLDQIVNDVSNLLSDLTHTGCFATLPSKANMKIQTFKIVEIRKNECLIIIVFEGGITEKVFTKLDHEIPLQRINNISNFLNELALGLTLEELKDKIINKVKAPLSRYSSIMETLIKFSMDAFDKENTVDVLMHGKLTQFNDNALDNLEISKNLLHVFEEKEFLLELMESVLKDNITKVFIGSYNGMPTGLSMIAAPYGNGITQGSLGVFGPIRMNYSQLIPLVTFSADYLTSVMDLGGTNVTWR